MNIILISKLYNYLCKNKVVISAGEKRMSKIRCSVLFILCILFCFRVNAQDGEKAFRFLEMPTSVRVDALGGTNVSLIDNDISLVFYNPAALGKEMNMRANLNYLSYLADIKAVSAIFGKSLGDVSSFAVGVNYMDYGKFTETSINEIVGEFQAKDIVVNGIYSHMLTDRLRGGVNAKFIYSSYAEFTSTAIGFDVGLSYYNEDSEFSAGLVLKNIGAQLSSYTDKRVGLPWDVQVGMSKKLRNAPIRFSLTGRYLTQWDFYRVNAADGIDTSEDNFFKTFIKHTVIGVDVLPSKNLWLGVGFNPKVNSDMKLKEGGKWGGFNAGAGIKIQKFSVGFSLAQYHPSATTYHFNVAFDMSKF